MDLKPKCKCQNHTTFIEKCTRICLWLGGRQRFLKSTGFIIHLCIKIDKIHNGVRWGKVMTELQRQNKQWAKVWFWSAGGISLKSSIHPAFVALWMRGGPRKKFYIQENSAYCHNYVYNLFHGNSPSLPTPSVFRVQARYITSPTKVHIVKAMTFPIVIMNVRVEP